MKLIRFDSRLVMIVVLSALLIGSCSSSPPISSALEPTPSFEVLDLCEDPPTFKLFDLQAASVMQTLLEGTELGMLGDSGAEDLAREYFSPTDTFCELVVPQELVSALDGIQDLIDSGQPEQADQQLDDLLKAVEAGSYSFSRVQKNAAPQAQAGSETTRAKVRSFLAIAARAQYWGNDAKSDAAMDSARKTYKNWASEAIDNATIKEALRIAAEAQLLGLEDLDGNAQERARDLAELDLMGELDLYQPCTATREDTGRLLDTAARAQLLGVDTDSYDFMSQAREWLEIQRLRKEGEDVPQCDLWEIDMVLDEVWDRGSHLIDWEGQFKVLEDDTLSGEGTGTLATHTEVNCVNLLTGEEYMSTTDVSGSFTFRIEGERIGSGEESQFRFLFPAEVDYSGVDTCNEFDETTYLPAFVIKEINVFGGVENYDPEVDTIYMVLPAEDGASQIYETLIGTAELRLRSLGEPAE